MAKKTITTYTCDFCGQGCDPVRELVHYHSTTYGNHHNRIILHIAGEIPYGKAEDICSACVSKALKDHSKVFASMKDRAGE